MTPERWTLARNLFDELLEADREERVRRLEALTQRDASMGRALQALFDSHDQLTDTHQDPLAREINRAVSELWPAAAAGERFGSFEVVRELGRGGMGIVYLADRHDGAVEQRVALKVLPQAQHDPDSTKRLLHERQLLASLEHPNIARLIDAGESDAGIPYFSMEYVSGVAINRFCDEHNMSIERRLHLFDQVCAAVEYAHSRLVVHGDLKPGNILVTSDAMPKLLDFGIAVSLASPSSAIEERLGTSSGQRFFSANAAAPEQLLGGHISIATDVYALGVLLCELLGGKRPHDLASLAPEQIAAVVLHQPPNLPSTSASVGAAAQRSCATLGRLQRQLRGDLDAIVAKALQKSPLDRYATVVQLRADLRRHLEKSPVSARGEETGYRALRFVQRNALILGFAALLLALLLGFLMYALRQNVRLERERDSAHRQELEARFERDRAEQVKSFLIDLFRAADPASAQGRSITAQQLLLTGTQRLESELAEQPQLRADMLAAIADIYIELDEIDLAQKAADEAWRLREAARPDDHSGVAASLRQRARLANLRGRHDVALGLIDAADRMLPNTDVGTELSARSIRARALEGLGRTSESIAAWEEALNLATRLPKPDPWRRLRVAGSLSHVLRAAGQLPAAEQVIREHLPHSDLPAAGENDALRAELGLELAIFARNRNALEEASTLAQNSLAALRRIYGDESLQVASAANTVATIVQAGGDDAAASELFEQSLAIKRTVLGADNPRVAGAEYNVGLMRLLRLKQPGAAEPYLRRAVEIGARALPPTHANLANFRLGWGSALRDLGRTREAEAELNQALAAFIAIDAPRGIDIALARGELACLRLDSAVEHTTAERELAAARAILRKEAPQDPQALRVLGCVSHFR